MIIPLKAADDSAIESATACGRSGGRCRSRCSERQWICL